MKTPRTILLLTITFCGSVFAQYSVEWWKVSGGGGTSSGGVLAASSNVGQSEAGGPMTNGQFSVVGGYWVLPAALQTPGAPRLSILPALPGWATISWPPDDQGYFLQMADDIRHTNWVNAPSGTNNPVTVRTSEQARFYRLRKL